MENDRSQRRSPSEVERLLEQMKAVQSTGNPQRVRDYTTPTAHAAINNITRRMTPVEPPAFIDELHQYGHVEGEITQEVYNTFAGRSNIMDGRVTPQEPTGATEAEGTEVPRSSTLGKNIEEIMSLRADKAELESQIKDINETIERLEYAAIQQLEEAGLEKVKTARGSATLKVDMYPQVEDLDAIVKWAYENGRSDILQRRVSPAVFKEIFEQQGVFPDGVKTFQKKTLNYRKA